MLLVARKDFIQPVQLNGTYTTSVGPVGVHEFVVQYRLDLLAKEPTAWVNRDGLVAHDGSIAAIWDQPCNIRGETSEEAL